MLLTKMLISSNKIYLVKKNTSMIKTFFQYTFSPVLSFCIYESLTPNYTPHKQSQFQGHWMEMYKIRVRSISSIWRSIGCSYFTRMKLMTRGFVMILSQGHLGRFKVIGRKSS